MWLVFCPYPIPLSLQGYLMIFIVTEKAFITSTVAYFKCLYPRRLLTVEQTGV